MGLQWCPRDPLLKIGDRTLILAARIPVQFQNRFEAMSFTVKVPENVETEILYVEDQATVTFVPEKHRKHGNDYAIGVECKISGVPDDTPAQLLMFGAWSESGPMFVEGTAGDLSSSITI